MPQEPATTEPHANGASFPKAARLRKDRDFAAVRAKSRRFAGREIVVRVARTGGAGARVGIGVPRWYGKQVRRNRFRRLVREAFRAVRADLPPVDMIVLPRNDVAEPSLSGIRADLIAAAARSP